MVIFINYANIMNITVDMLYPPVNGSQDKAHLWLSRSFRPFWNNNMPLHSITILWTSSTGASKPATNVWLPNRDVQ